jgi:hypothetical protein
LGVLLEVRSVQFEETDVVEPAWLSYFEVFDGVLTLFDIFVPLLLVLLPLSNLEIPFSFLI